jgi:hypothetical protein
VRQRLAQLPTRWRRLWSLKGRRDGITVHCAKIAAISKSMMCGG